MQKRIITQNPFVVLMRRLFTWILEDIVLCKPLLAIRKLEYRTMITKKER